MILVFFFSTSFITKAEEPSLANHLTIADKRKKKRNNSFPKGNSPVQARNL